MLAGIMDSDTSLILWWLIGFSYFIHMVHAVVATWDRIRLKPGIMERLGGFVDTITFGLFKKEVADRFDLCARSKDLETFMRVSDTRFERLSNSIKETQRTNNALYTDLLKALSRLEGAFEHRPRQ